MSSRRYGSSEVTIDDRRERDYVSRTGGSSRHDDRYYDQEIEFRRSAPPVREREREREEIDIREERTRAPSFLREDYGRTTAGPVVLRAREREDFEFVTRPRRRSPSPEPDRRTERESIVIRTDREESEPRPPPRRERERSREREEIIIRRDRDERERSRPAPPPPPPPPPPEDDIREEIIIRREERSRSRPPARDDRAETERIIIRRQTDDDRPRYEPPPPREIEREEIVIRRDREEDNRSYAPPRRAVSRERERSVVRHDDSESEHEVVIRRDKSKGRGRDATRETEEIIIRDKSRSVSRSPSPVPSVAPSARSVRSSRPQPPPEPQVVYAPQIHQEVITHHRHIDHGYELAIAPRPRPVSRPPSPPTPPSPQAPPPPPPPAREQSEERIEIRRSGERNGETYDEDIIIDRNEGTRSAPSLAPRYESPPRRERRFREERDFEEDDYYSQRTVERSYPREGRRARHEGGAYSSIEISREISRPSPPPAPIRRPEPEPEPATGGDIGRRYARTRDPKAGLWTEITKDLVVKEAIIDQGYEYEETDKFYYIIAYLEYEDVARLVALSEDIKKDRRSRVKEIEWESRIGPEIPPPRRPLAIEPPLPVRSPRPPRGVWEREDDRYIEREVIYRGSRRPPPPGWR